MRSLALIAFLFFAGCTHLATPPIVKEAPPPPVITHEFAEDERLITLVIPQGAIDSGEAVRHVLRSYAQDIPYHDFFPEVEDDSVRNLLALKLRESFQGDTLSPYFLKQVITRGDTISITVQQDQHKLNLLASHVREQFGLLPPVIPSAAVEDDFSYLMGQTFLLPCSGTPVPRQANLLPNAPRPYRSGIHRGIDFPAPYGIPVRSILDGVVIRADHGYQEVTPVFRESLLETASTLGHTPSDVFEHILLGRSVFVDHGMDVVAAKRLVSFYAHLSDIDHRIYVGSPVTRGQQLGRVGNSGTGDGAKGTKRGAHLHFELIIQDNRGERYLGQGLAYPEVYNLLSKVFTK